jgi:hypothetical protein
VSRLLLRPRLDAIHSLTAATAIVARDLLRQGFASWLLSFVRILTVALEGLEKFSRWAVLSIVVVVCAVA